MIYFFIATLLISTSLLHSVVEKMSPEYQTTIACAAICGFTHTDEQGEHRIPRALADATDRSNFFAELQLCSPTGLSLANVTPVRLSFATSDDIDTIVHKIGTRIGSKDRRQTFRVKGITWWYILQRCFPCRDTRDIAIVDMPDASLQSLQLRQMADAYNPAAQTDTDWVVLKKPHALTQAPLKDWVMIGEQHPQTPAEWIVVDGKTPDETNGTQRD